MILIALKFVRRINPWLKGIDKAVGIYNKFTTTDDDDIDLAIEKLPDDISFEFYTIDHSFYDVTGSFYYFDWSFCS